MKTRSCSQAFSLVENLMAIALVSLLGLSLGGMVILAGKLAAASRAEITAAEILEAKLEALRSCSWENIKTPQFVPTAFSITNGTVFNGAITTQLLSGSETYHTNLLRVFIQVNWTMENRTRSRAVCSFISPYGFSAP